MPYLLPSPDILQALIERAHPPVIIRDIRRLLLAQTELVLLVGDQERFLDAAAVSVEGVA